MEIETKIRKIGHSMGIVTAIPKEFVESNNLKVGNTINVKINIKTQPKIWGLLKGIKEKSKKSVDEILDEGWEND